MPGRPRWPAPPKAAEISQVTRSRQFGGQREDFHVGPKKNAGFVILPPKPAADGSKPWIWYAPTFVGSHGALPDREHEWIFQQLVARGFAVAGVDVGESFGNPAGRAAFTEFYRAVVKRYGLDRKACLLAQSRGGLMLYNWAAEHPDCVQCIGGIYTVCDQSSWPGLAKSCPAYGMTEAELAKHLASTTRSTGWRRWPGRRFRFCTCTATPTRWFPWIATAASWSAATAPWAARLELVVVKGKGHEVCPEFFENQRLLDFPATGETSGCSARSRRRSRKCPTATRPASAATSPP